MRGQRVNSTSGARQLAGLDAIIAASRQRRTPATEQPAAVGVATPGTPESSDDDDDQPEYGTTAQAARGSAPTQSEPPSTSGRTAEGRVSRRVPKGSLLRDEEFLADAGTDSSEDERAPRNTIGAVPLEWYNDEEHIGYDRHAFIPAATTAC